MGVSTDSTMQGVSRVHVLLPADRLFRDVGVMITDVLRGRGLEATAAHEATPAALDCDLLLLAGDCRKLRNLPELLRRRPASGPRTVFWDLEPLPPPALSRHGEAVGRKVAACTWARLPRFWGKLLEGVVPYRTRLVRALRSYRARSYAAEVERDPQRQGWGEFDSDSFFFVMTQYLWVADMVAAGALDHVCATTRPRVEFLESRGIPATFVPLGAHAAWGRDLQIERDVDVLFLGRFHGNRRARLLQRLGSELKAKGRKLEIVDHGCWGEDRDRLLSRTKVLLNLPKFPWEFCGMRILMGMACGALVVSEACGNAEPYEPGVHFAWADVDRLSETILHYLDHEQERAGITRRARTFLERDLTLAESLETMLRTCAGKPLPVQQGIL